MFDLIVIGGGPGGYAAAEFAAQNGMAVALVEKDRLGGTCLNRGCVPTKAYLHFAEAAHAAQAFAPDAVARFDRAAMLARKNEIVETLVGGVATLMKNSKVTVFEGHGTLQSGAPPFQVLVTGAEGKPETLTAARVLLATGSAPARLPVAGAGDPGVFVSDDLLAERGAEAFGSLLIIGGGVIGVEMASIYARLGAAVTVMEAEARILPMLDIDLSRSAEMMLRGMGVTCITGARLQSIESVADGFTATVEKGGAPGIYAAERVLLATGRMPVTDGLLAEGVALAMNRRFIAVDGDYQTSVRGVYAIGDVNGQNQLAHAAHAQGLAAVSHMLGKPSPIDPLLVPACVYTAPEIASVGITQAEAKERGLETVVGKALTTQNARTLIEGLGRGFVKLVFERESRRLVGAQLFCGRATDMVGELALAVQTGLTAAQMLRTLRPHPTFEETVTDAVAGRQILTPSYPWRSMLQQAASSCL